MAKNNLPKSSKVSSKPQALPKNINRNGKNNMRFTKQEPNKKG